MTKEEYIEHYRNLQYLCYRDGDDMVYGESAEAYLVLTRIFNVPARGITKIEREAWEEYCRDGKPQGI